MPKVKIFMLDILELADLRSLRKIVLSAIFQHSLHLSSAPAGEAPEEEVWYTQLAKARVCHRKSPVVTL